MTIDAEENDPASSPEPDDPLQQIAMALGLPIEAFTRAGPLRDEAAQHTELLKLWIAIPDHAGREAVLAYARALVRDRA